MPLSLAGDAYCYLTCAGQAVAFSTAKPQSKDFPCVKPRDFDVRPLLVIWEMTQACDLNCTHCRANSRPLRHPLELSTAEAFHLIDQVAAMKVPLFVLTGGDPSDLIFSLSSNMLADGVCVRRSPRAQLRSSLEMLSST